MPDLSNIPQDPVTVKVAAGTAGSVLSLRFIPGTWPERLSLAAGGAALSYFGTEWVASKLGMPKELGLVGFFLGLFGMAAVAKCYEVANAIDTKKIASAITDRIQKVFGG